MAEKNDVPLMQKLRKCDVVKNYGAYLLVMPAVILVAIFCYAPMVGIIIAFEQYDPMLGIFGSKLIGIQNFIFFFSGSDWLVVTVNTLYLNCLFLITGTVMSTLIAIMISEFRGGKLLKTSQTLMTLPNFISWTTLALFTTPFLVSDGVINGVLEKLGMNTVEFYSAPGAWPWIFVFLRIWKGAGWGSIIVTASILGVDSELFEAARIDGASDVQVILKIKLPMVSNVIVLTLLLSIGNIFRGDFGMIYPFVGDNSVLFPTTDVIDTYVFRALRTSTNYGSTAALGLYQSVLGFLLVLVSNWMARRYSPSAALF